jgi:hypothetical protein
MSKCQECKGKTCPFNIDLMSTNELIVKLLERSALLGIFIHSEDEAIPGAKHENFVISCNKQLNPQDLTDILMAAAAASTNEVKI